MNTATAKLIPLCLAWVCATTNAWAHDTDPRSADIKPRIGQISDEVARQRLTNLGLENPEVLSREGDQINVRALKDGQAITLRMHALSGAIADTRDTTGKSSSIPGLEIKHVPIKSQVSPTREQISDKALMERAASPR